jgi:hypothetical protein
VDLLKWWGNDDWKILARKPCFERGVMLAERFKKEFGYNYSYAFPIYQRDGVDAGKIMFWMIHASDHEGSAEADDARLQQRGGAV